MDKSFSVIPTLLQTDSTEANLTAWLSTSLEVLHTLQVKPLHARTRAKFLCQICATSLQNSAILRNIPKYIIPYIILILLSLFVAVYPHLPSTSDF